MQYEASLIPAAAPSPRIVGGVLKWYAGDVFELQVQLELEDQYGFPIEIAEGHTIMFVFRNARREVVYQVVFKEIADNTVILQFDEAVTSQFPAGNYTYDVIYQGVGRRTLAHNAPIQVEGGSRWG